MNPRAMRGTWDTGTGQDLLEALGEAVGTGVFVSGHWAGRTGNSQGRESRQRLPACPDTWLSWFMAQGKSLGLPKSWKRERNGVVIVSAVCPGIQKHRVPGKNDV